MTPVHWENNLAKINGCCCTSPGLLTTVRQSPSIATESLNYIFLAWQLIRRVPFNFFYQMPHLVADNGSTFFSRHKKTLCRVHYMYATSKADAHATPNKPRNELAQCVRVHSKTLFDQSRSGPHGKAKIVDARQLPPVLHDAAGVPQNDNSLLLWCTSFLQRCTQESAHSQLGDRSC